MEISEIFNNIGDALSSFLGTLGTGISHVFELFWNNTDGVLTPLGVLVVAALGVGLAWTAFRLIKGAIKGVTKSN